MQISSRFHPTGPWLLAIGAICALGFSLSPSWGQPVQSAPGDRAAAATHTQTQGGVTVRVSIPGPAEVESTFGVPVLEKGIQPVWVEITNPGPDPLWYLPITTDPTYYSPLEVAYRFHEDLRPEANSRRDAVFMRSRMREYIRPGDTNSGFVFTHRETGLKFLTLGLIQGHKQLDFRYIIPVPGPGYAVEKTDFSALVPRDKLIAVDLPGLRAALGSLACCTSNAEGSKPGDPLNVVIVGEGTDVIFALVRRGWKFSQALDLRSAIDTAAAFVFHTQDDISPVSPLYVFGRMQDAALQKARNTINERNHMRLWMTPLRYEGQPVWIGQISRDIGVELTTKSWYGTTHKIDPMIDFDREYLLQDLLLSGAVTRFGYVAGVGRSTTAEPRFNLEGDPYYTDGLRLIVFVSSSTQWIPDVGLLDWEHPATTPSTTGPR